LLAWTQLSKRTPSTCELCEVLSIISLNSISHGAALFLGGKVLSRGIGLLTNIFLTRTLGTNLYGIYSYLGVIFSLARVFTQLGSDKAILRYLPEYEDNIAKKRAILTLAYGTSLVGSLIIALVIYHFAPIISQYTLSDPLFVNALQVAAIVIPFNTLSKISLSVFKSIERMDYFVGISSVATPVFRLIFIGGAVLLGYSVVGAAAGIVVSGVLTFLLGILVLRRQTDLLNIESPNISDSYEYYNFSVPLTFNHLGNFLYNRVDLLMVGFLLTGSAVGIYKIAVLLSGILILPLTAFNQLFPPIASRLYQNGDLEQLEQVYCTVTRWSFTLSLFPTITIILYADEVLNIFGEGFTEGAAVLVLFAFAQFTNSAVGASGYLLMMSDHQYLTLANQLGSGILNALLNYVLILQLGYIGAAVATAITLTSINLLRVSQVWYIEGVQPYNRSFYKPIIAGLSSAIVLFVFSHIFSQYMLIFVGGVAGASCFVSILYLLGLEEEEIRVLKQVLP
jgi:O-antigen/teichoic acid export membrane protein